MRRGGKKKKKEEEEEQKCEHKHKRTKKWGDTRDCQMNRENVNQLFIRAVSRRSLINLYLIA